MDHQQRLALDAAIAKGANEGANRAMREVLQIEQAERSVLPYVGAVIGQDSAAGVYKVALARMGYDTRALHPFGAESTFKALKDAPRRIPSLSPSQRAAMLERFPHADRLKT